MNFRQALIDNREADAYERLLEAEQVATDDLLWDLQRGTKEQRELAADKVLDHFNGAGEGRAAFQKLIDAALEEEPKLAREAIDEALMAIARWEVENR